MNGLPWNTKIAVRFGVDATLPDGSAYHNEGMQYLRIVWGRIIEDRLYEDTDLLRRALLTIESRAALQPDKSTP
jgi:ketosteroid isomerase-like protein